MNIKNVKNGLGLAYLGLVAGTAGYFTHRALNEKADELVEEGGAVNAVLVGMGQMGVSIAVGIMTCAVINGLIVVAE